DHDRVVAQEHQLLPRIAVELDEAQGHDLTAGLGWERDLRDRRGQALAWQIDADAAAVVVAKLIEAALVGALAAAGERLTVVADALHARAAVLVDVALRVPAIVIAVAPVVVVAVVVVAVVVVVVPVGVAVVVVVVPLGRVGVVGGLGRG